MFGDKPSIADLSLACELGQLESFGFPLREKYPSIGKWLYEYMMESQNFKKIHEDGIAKMNFLV